LVLQAKKDKMRKTSLNAKLFVTLAIIGTVALFISCSDNKPAAVSQGTVDSLRKQVMELPAGNAMIASNLATFDSLDYTVFSNQQWARLHESHAKEIKVNWPDGHATVGIERHIADLRAMFTYAPNTSIKQHPVRFGSGNMTCVIGVMTGTFTASMPVGIGKFIQPTGKSFSLPMCTVGIWKDGVMVEEYLFWDNQSYMNQIGIEK
jgi:hypothetical protein